MQHGRGMISRENFDLLKNLCTDEQNNQLDKGLLRSITGMQSGKGMISREEFNMLKTLCTDEQKNQLDKGLLRSITGMQHGRGMISREDFELLTRKFTNEQGEFRSDDFKKSLKTFLLVKRNSSDHLNKKTDYFKDFLNFVKGSDCLFDPLYSGVENSNSSFDIEPRDDDIFLFDIEPRDDIFLSDIEPRDNDIFLDDIITFLSNDEVLQETPSTILQSSSSDAQILDDIITFLSNDEVLQETPSTILQSSSSNAQILQLSSNNAQLACKNRFS
jgi:hypothetical protein